MYISGTFYRVDAKEVRGEFPVRCILDFKGAWIEDHLLHIAGSDNEVYLYPCCEPGKTLDHIEAAVFAGSFLVKLDACKTQ